MEPYIPLNKLDTSRSVTALTQIIYFAPHSFFFFFYNSLKEWCSIQNCSRTVDCCRIVDTFLTAFITAISELLKLDVNDLFHAVDYSCGCYLWLNLATSTEKPFETHMIIKVFHIKFTKHWALKQMLVLKSMPCIFQQIALYFFSYVYLNSH